jgi:hypothetical protein
VADGAVFDASSVLYKIQGVWFPTFARGSLVADASGCRAIRDGMFAKTKYCVVRKDTLRVATSYRNCLPLDYPSLPMGWGHLTQKEVKT